MKTRRSLLVLSVSLLLAPLTIGLAQAQGQTGTDTASVPAGVAAVQTVIGTAFTYQGKLQNAGGPINGTCDLRFALWDDAGGGGQVGAALTLEEVALTEGLFTAQLDFGGVHDGAARWLEVAVRCPAGSGDYVTLSPRQELTAAPAALALKLPYTARANIGGPVVAFHNTGDGEAALFSSALGYALWVESAGLDGVRVASAGQNGLKVVTAGAHGLEVDAAGGSGVHVASAAGDGLAVDTAGTDGVYVGRAGNPSGVQWSDQKNGFEVTGAQGNGLYVGRADSYGVHVNSAGGIGVYVEEAYTGMYVGWAVGDGFAVPGANGAGLYVGTVGQDGVRVHQAGSPSGVQWSAPKNGFEVAGAEGYGLYVGRADLDGVHVASAAGAGLAVDAAGGDGVYVGAAGSPSSTTASGMHNGVEVAGAKGAGLYVGRADNTGVYVDSALYGMAVGSADADGMSVGSAGTNGFRVSNAGFDGFNVFHAGTPSSDHSSDQSNGFEVGGAQGHGLYVGRADNTGVFVHSAGWNGVIVEAAGGDGVRATATTYNALYGDTANAQGEWGVYTPDKVHAQNVTLQTLTLIAQVSGPDTLSSGDVVAAAGVGASLPGISAPLPLVRLAGSEASGVVGVVEGRLALIPVPQPEGEEAGERLELRSAEGPAQPGDTVALTILGLARVRVEASQGAIQPGKRLTGGTAGQARALKTVVVEGVTLAESAPTIGIALAAPDADGLVWVLVNPQ